ncbi:alpha-ketoacid dehydrogenase subunit alpha/beta [Acinetobacter gerneri]|jgi:2-oxoisovalerate dehydrogenase E1 component|uniref:alpha-ketoacid dehydrogenase subunit alpha/beta n=1 Tax=Acinetobacter gerneri TaxID=202952 RepID=UPI0023F47129|nr:alpha-ketoacid dehydrogenase subunit alpha/beta [Acinetobacter gerneri]MCH4246080.1 thiamine pyrophosphate-dependent enzyme [Acinetobacter gerneri]
MSNQINLYPESPWIELQSTQEDWNQADPALLESMLTQLHIVRAFEESVLELAGEGLVHGPAHSSIGQEGGAVGSIISLTAADQVNGSHRGHHQFLAKALTYLRPEGMKAGDAFGADIQDVLQRTLAEILGLAQGFCKGRGGSMHLQWIEAGALGTNAIVGGGAPMAAGAAWAHRHAETDAIAITYFGDGAVNIGSVLETMNLAAAWKLPICFFIENNRYAVSTSVEEATAETRLSSRGSAFNIPSWKVDGMDPLAVHLTMQQALQHMREGKGPTIVEADVYRFFHQNGPYPGSAFGYRSKEEEQEWKVRDPIILLENKMIERGLIAVEQITALRTQCQSAMAEAVAELTEPAAKGKRRIRPELWPSEDFVDVGIRGDLSEIANVETQEQESFTDSLVKGKFIDAVANVMNRRMDTDDSIVVMGEDIHRLKGGTNGATKGLKERFPTRTLGTPISENAFMGLGGGIAVDGRFKPVVEFMYPDFMWVAADQVFNQIGKARHMFGGQSDVPLVLRTKIAMGTGYGSQHSMDPAGIFVTNPGWRIVAASTPFDYIGLMNFALACNDPVLVIEHVDLYSKSGLLPENNLDYQIPFAKAAVRRQGQALTILTYLSMVDHSLEAVEQTGVDAEVIDLRFLDRASLDWDTIEASIRKTNNVLIVEQGNQGTSYGGWLSDELQRRCFDWLDQPIQRVHGTEGAPSISKVLERAAAARTEEVVEGLQRVMRDKGEAI